MSQAHESQEVSYPDSDGEPMGETPLHVLNIAWVLDMLLDHFRDDQQAFVGGNMFVYYEPGNNRAHVSPDLLVSFGVPSQRVQPRTNYLIWEEGKPMDCVIEFLSPSTAASDLESKRDLYRHLGVGEYFLFDPQFGMLSAPLIGYRLDGGEYVSIEAGVGGRLVSETLGLELLGVGTDILRLYDPESELWLRVPEEVRDSERDAQEQVEHLTQERDKERQQREEALQERDEERQRRQEAEKEIEELRRQLREARGESED